MAAVKTFELPDNTSANKVQYTIQEFHNRSSLFPSTQNNRLLSSPSVKNTETDSAWSELQLTSHKINANSKQTRHAKLNTGLPPSGQKSATKFKSVKSKNDKSQKSSTSDKTSGSSVKAFNQLDSNSDIYTSCHSDSQAWDDTESCSYKHDSDSGISRCYSPSSMMIVPAGGRQVPVVDVGDEAPFPAYHFYEKKAHKYISPDVRAFVFSSASSQGINTRPFSANVSKTEDSSAKDRRKRPSSAKSSRVKSDKLSEDIIPSVFGMQSNRQVFGNTVEVGSTNTGTCPYKLSNDGETLKAILPADDQNKNIPTCLEPLLPWRNFSLQKKDLGIDPSKFLVFLPHMDSDQYAELPFVPAPQNSGEELPHKGKITTIPPFDPKKYEHPAFNKKPVDEWVCKHRKPTTSYHRDKNELTTRRPIGVVRKEIEELENLLNGIGTLDSNCIMTKYQAEIEFFRQTYNDTMAKVPERLRNPPEPEDTFGLRKFYTEHDEAMAGIRHRHTLCLMELAELEVDIGIESDRKYFKHQIYLPLETDPE